MLKPFAIIVAVDQKNGIGKKGNLPWTLSEDMKHFKAVTTATQSLKAKNAVIMGRKTWESIPEKFRPLSNRLNIVLTKNAEYALSLDVVRACDFTQALELAAEPQRYVQDIFVIGGASVYAQALLHPQCRKIFITKIEADFDCDVRFPDFDKIFHQVDCSPVQQSEQLRYRFLTYERSESVLSAS